MFDDQWYEYDNAQGNPAQYVIAAYPQRRFNEKLAYAYST